MKKLFTFLIFTILFQNLFSQELLTNGNFTSNGVAWTTTGNFSYNTTYSQYNFDVGYAYSSDDPNHSGTIEQQFTIPSNTTSANLSFYVNISSDEQTNSQVFDFCTVNLFTVGGGNNYQFIILSNLDENNAYQQMNFTIPSSFYGENVRLVMIFGNDGATASRFRFDNVSVQATVSGSGGGSSNPDFYVYNENINVSSVNAGDNVSVSCRQANQGSLPNEVDVYLGYYLSSDQQLSNNDYQFSTTDYSNLGDGDLYDNESATLTIPSSTASGQYYVISKADYNEQFVESNEQNNTVSVPIYVNGQGPPAPSVQLINPSNTICVAHNSNLEILTQVNGSVTSKLLELEVLH